METLTFLVFFYPLTIGGAAVYADAVYSKAHTLKNLCMLNVCFSIYKN